MEKPRDPVELLAVRDFGDTTLPDCSPSEEKGERSVTMTEPAADSTFTETELRMRNSTTMLLLIVWLAVSCGLVMSNKYIIHTLNFTHPATLTCWHQIFAVIIAQGSSIFEFSRSAGNGPTISPKDYGCIILPIAALFALSLVCNNMPYLSLSVAFIQMLKGMGPAAALLAMWSLGLQSLEMTMCFNIGIIVLGTSISSVGELKFRLSGFLYQITGLLFDGYRLGLTRILLSGNKKIEPLAAMNYMAPPSALMLGFIAAVTEWPTLRLEDFRNVGAGMFLVNGASAFVLNMVIFKLLGRTRPLTLPLCAELKKILLVLASIVLWGDSITLVQLLGYMITTTGLLSTTIGIDSVREYLSARLRILSGFSEPRAEPESAIPLVSKQDF